MMQKIRIKYFYDDMEKLTYIDGKSDWIDLRAAEDVEMKAGEFKLVPLGIAMELPKGYEAHVVPRSSTYKNFGIIQTNHMGPYLATKVRNSAVLFRISNFFAIIYHLSM